MSLTDSDLAISLTIMASETSEAIAAMIVERQAARSAEWQLRRDAKAKVRAERKAARDAGLVRRHAGKLARLRTTADSIR
jgi:hypothetical protein